MNDLEKTDSLEESVKMTPVSNEAESEKVAAECTATEKESECVETESPAMAVSEAADTIEEEKNALRFHEMNKEELLAAIREILASDNMEAHREVAAIKQAFFNIRSKEGLQELNKFIEEGNAPEDFSATADETEAEFKNLYTEFKEKRASYLAAEELKRKENLDRKLEILEKMKAISGDIDTINIRFPEFQQLQQDFKAIKDIPAGAENETWKTFQVVVEQFYDHLKMNKELRDLDFKKNLEIKRALVAEAKDLGTLSDPIAAFRRLQALHDDWRSTGPVAKDLRDSLWEEFKEASTVVNRRHQEFFEQRKQEEQANEDAKTAICEEIEGIDVAGLKSFNDWNEQTAKIIALQEKWRGFGYASKKMNSALYTRFRKACDDFFAAKTSYFQKTKEEFSNNLAAKTRLCEQAEALGANEDLNKAANEVVKLQAEWKKIGSVPRKQSDAIWQRFQTACNAIFNERKKAYAGRRQEENANLEAKRAIIEQLKALPKDGDRREVIGKVKELQAEWQKAGFVPFKLKDKIYAEYREVCDALYGAYESRENKARISNFKERIDSMKSNGDQMGRERDRLIRAYEAKKNEIKTIENNMGFFNVKSSAGNSMLKEMERKLARLKEDMKQIEDKIAIIDSEG